MEYSWVVLRAADQWTAEAGARHSHHSPLDALDPLFAKSAETRRSDGRSLTITSYPIPPQSTHDLRRAALRIAASMAQSPDLPMAMRALASFDTALHGPLPFANRQISDEEIQGWIPDQLYAMEQLKYVLAHTLHPLLHLQIKKVLIWHARNGASEEVKGKSEEHHFGDSQLV